MSGEPEPLSIDLPPELKNGVYANAAAVWHTPYDFTLDFLSMGSPEGPRTSATVVTRVKVPIQVIFQIASAIAENVDRYEKTFGSIAPAPSVRPDKAPE